MITLHATVQEQPVRLRIDLTDPRMHSFEGEGRSWAAPTAPTPPSYDINPLW